MAADGWGAGNAGPLGGPGGWLSLASGRGEGAQAALSLSDRGLALSQVSCGLANGRSLLSHVADQHPQTCITGIWEKTEFLFFETARCKFENWSVTVEPWGGAQRMDLQAVYTQCVWSATGVGFPQRMAAHLGYAVTLARVEHTHHAAVADRFPHQLQPLWAGACQWSAPRT